MKKVSVVIPVYKDIRVAEAIRSVLGQDYPDVEVIVADNSPSPELRPLIEGLGDSRVICVTAPVTGNANAARQCGTLQATGDYVAYLDADDLFMSGYISGSVAEMERTGADALYGGVCISRDESIVAEMRPEPPLPGEAPLNFLLRRGYAAPTSTLFLRRGAAVQTGWDTSLLRHQDYDFFIRLVRSFTAVCHSHTGVVYRITPPVNRIDLHSCIRFIRENRRQISPAVYHAYTRAMLRLAGTMGAEQAIRDYYRRELCRYPAFVTLPEYIDLLRPESRAEAVKYKAVYIWKLLTGGS